MQYRSPFLRYSFSNDSTITIRFQPEHQNVISLEEFLDFKHRSTENFIQFQRLVNLLTDMMGHPLSFQLLPKYQSTLPKCCL